MTRSFDTIVVGLGAMGSAVLRALSRRGWRVLGLDRHEPPHAFGSSHGRARVIREAYFEDPAYVPFVRRARLLWEELEREADRALIVPTGGVMIGPPDGVLVSGATRSAREHDLPCERLDAAEIRRRFPALRPADAWVGVWEPRTAVLEPEACVAALLATARRFGAAVRGGEPAVAWAPDGRGVRVTTPRGVYRAARLVLAAGAWVGALLADLRLPLTVERVVQFWFEPPAGDDLDPGRCPISIWEHEPGRFFYAFPRLGRAVKVALHHGGEIGEPDRLPRDVAPAEAEPLRELLGRFIPGAAGPLESAAACLYTNTPDGHFVIDAHPRHPQALIVSACSGHGFKFAPAIGEIVSDLLVEGETRRDLGLFRLARWA